MPDGSLKLSDVRTFNADAFRFSRRSDDFADVVEVVREGRDEESAPRKLLSLPVCH